MSFNFEIKDAEREKIYPKIALMGASGSGKSYSALRLATGMVKAYKEILNEDWTIVMLNTEGSRGRYYANEFKFKIIDLSEPFPPELFVEGIQYVEKLGKCILIIDSSSHEWEGKGGCLELHAQAGGKYQDWAKISPRHDKFINAIASSKIPIIATMRGKDQYVMAESDRNGYKKTTVEKIGVGAKQRDGFEYEFTATFLLEQKTNIVDPMKDNTHIFEKEIGLIMTEDHGYKIVKWANESTTEPKETLKDMLVKIEDNIGKLMTEENKPKIANAIKEAGCTTKISEIKNIEIAKAVLNKLEGGI